MSHEPTLYEDGPDHWWFECSCGFMGDARESVYGASNRWMFHMTDVMHRQIREAVARGAKHAVDM